MTMIDSDVPDSGIANIAVTLAAGWGTRAYAPFQEWGATYEERARELLRRMGTGSGPDDAVQWRKAGTVFAESLIRRQQWSRPEHAEECGSIALRPGLTRAEYIARTAVHQALYWDMNTVRGRDVFVLVAGELPWFTSDDVEPSVRRLFQLYRSPFPDDMRNQCQP